MKKYLGLAVVILAALIGLGWFAGGFALEPVVDVVRPVHGPAVQAVYATGTVEATVMLPIAARNGARLTALYADEGSEVKKDEVLGQLEDTDLQNSLREFQAREIYAQREYERKAALVKSGTATRESVDQARTEWDAAKAIVAQTQAQIDYMKLLSPADGRIIQRDGEIGQFIPSGQAVFWLSCCAPLRISAEVDEEDVPLVQPGQSVLIRADAFPGQVFHGKVQSITPKGDPVARSYRVRISLPEDTPLLIGMTAETNIMIQQRKDALLLPASAVSNGSIWIVRDRALTQQAVEVGAKGPEQVEIRNGLTAEDLVVATPDDSLKAGAKVRTKELPQQVP